MKHHELTSLLTALDVLNRLNTCAVATVKTRNGKEVWEYQECNPLHKPKGQSCDSVTHYAGKLAQSLTLIQGAGRKRPKLLGVARVWALFGANMSVMVLQKRSAVISFTFEPGELEMLACEHPELLWTFANGGGLLNVNGESSIKEG